MNELNTNHLGVGRVERRPSTADLTWFLDLEKNGQLDLDPAYQRRSVWTAGDRRYFLDTIFRNYPSPAIFLHKSIDEDGSVTYHVVDGKQRISTILQFVQNKIALPRDFNDTRLDGKRWRDIEGPLRRIFWNYPFTVENIDVIDGPIVKDVFARLNKNSRRLTRQELRHARFDGWFISFVEAEVQSDFWKSVKVKTTAKEKRMLDVQNVSELLAVVITRTTLGFDQDLLDEIYAEFDEADEEGQFERSSGDVLSSVELEESFDRAKDFLSKFVGSNNDVPQYVQTFSNLYSLWTWIVLRGPSAESAGVYADKYTDFMQEVEKIDLSGESEPVESTESSANSEAFSYKIATTGASTERPQRLNRFVALDHVLTS